VQVYLGPRECVPNDISIDLSVLEGTQTDTPTTERAICLSAHLPVCVSKFCQVFDTVFPVFPRFGHPLAVLRYVSRYFVLDAMLAHDRPARRRRLEESVYSK